MGIGTGPILLFDGVCNLCNGTVHFVIARDPEARIHFASLQSEFATQRFGENGIAKEYLDSIVLLENGQVFYKSTAALRLTRYLSGGWPMLRVLLIIPRPLRDLIYDWIAANRYRWFGKQESCWVPTPELRSRFLHA
ncbi:MAG: thiol-disulfide oxidoreductase DCC family protein [Flavobacteriales bacterium]|nr:thiol-disulfide oxidoreductase DCC family protein [Flavobacteriales bacterium]